MKKLLQQALNHLEIALYYADPPHPTAKDRLNEARSFLKNIQKKGSFPMNKAIEKLLERILDISWPAIPEHDGRGYCFRVSADDRDLIIAATDKALALLRQQPAQLDFAINCGAMGKGDDSCCGCIYWSALIIREFCDLLDAEVAKNKELGAELAEAKKGTDAGSETTSL